MPKNDNEAQKQATDATSQDLIQKLEQELEDAKKAQEEMLAQSQRALADYANLKKRFEKERQELAKFASESVVVQLLGSLDNLERAIAYATDSERQGGLYQGVRMTLQQIDATLANMGFVRMDVKEGNSFDPHLHEAVEMVDGPKDQIVQVIQSGYTLHEKVIRPARVNVGSGQEK
jgi:molecular chaperone GrpE